MARRLREAYGRPPRRKPVGVVESLVRTILSQNTTAGNAETAYRRLQEAFGGWEEVAAARLREIEAAIRPAGLARQRARVIRECVRRLMAEYPSLECRFLREMKGRAAVEYLQRLPGVGPKTAACVALFELGRDVFPVDTHILRVAKRLGWIGDDVDAVRAQEELEPLVPQWLRYELHVNMIAHGRRVCRARRAECGVCVLADLCPSAE